MNHNAGHSAYSAPGNGPWARRWQTLLQQLGFDVSAESVRGSRVKRLEVLPGLIISEEPEPAQIPLVGIAPAPVAEKAPDALLVHLDRELRTAAQAIMQDVINDFAPHIETEIKRRLDAHMERLLAQHQS